jgi:hypothetical protein
MRWRDEVRTGAAREFGARHHRALTVLEVLAVVARVLVPVLGTVAGLAMLVLGAWWLIATVMALTTWWWLWVGLGVLGVAVLTWAVVSLVSARGYGIRFYSLRHWW